MRQFIERLPGFRGKYTNELVAIAFYHFMDGKEMCFLEEHTNGFRLPIATQAGFKNAVLEDVKIRMCEKTIDKIIQEYNEKYVTPTEHRNLHTRLNETYDKYHELKRVYDFSVKHPIKYIIHRKKINERLKEKGVI